MSAKENFSDNVHEDNYKKENERIMEQLKKIKKENQKLKLLIKEKQADIDKNQV